MKRVKLKLMVAFATFLIGVLAATSWFISPPTPPKLHGKVDSPIVQGNINNARTSKDESESDDEYSGFECPSGKLNQMHPDTKLSVGDVTKKARILPKPKYPKAAKISGEVQAEVVIDAITGKIVWANIGNGHPLLREAVKNVVCQAEFYPTFINSPPIRANGIITYKFGRR